jgi:hypothetical protein
MAPLFVDHGCQSSRCVALLGLGAFSSKVAHLLAIEAWKVAGGKLLWWPSGSLLWQWSRSTVELLLQLGLLLELPRLELWLTAPTLLLLWSTQLTPMWVIHHAVLGRSAARTSTTSRSRHHFLPLLLINFNNSLHHSLLSMATLTNTLYDRLTNCIWCSCR